MSDHSSPKSATCYLIVSANAHEVQSGSLDLMLSSVNHHAARVVVVLRDCSTAEMNRVLKFAPDAIVGHIPNCGISEARNLGLALIDSQVADNDFIAFPDDDCSYAAGTLAAVAEGIHASPEVDVWTGSYAPTLSTVDRARFPARTRAADLQFLIRSASSVTMFVRASVMRRCGRFNPQLGTGTLTNAGEDTDLAIRLWMLGAVARYNPEILVFHEYRRRAVPPISWFLLTAAYRSMPGMPYLWLRSRISLLVRLARREISRREALATLRIASNPQKIGQVRSFARASRGTLCG